MNNPKPPAEPVEAIRRQLQIERDRVGLARARQILAQRFGRKNLLNFPDKDLPALLAALKSE
jgi:hypothetical protein